MCTDGICSPCPKGHYCLLSSELPQPCPSGSYAPVGSTSCILCPAGYACSNTDIDSPLACPTGTYSVGNATSCIICPAGFGCVATDSAPDPCAPGTYSTVGSLSCTICPLGSHCPTVDVLPLQCPPGIYIAAVRPYSLVAINIKIVYAVDSLILDITSLDLLSCCIQVHSVMLELWTAQFAHLDRLVQMWLPLYLTISVFLGPFQRDSSSTVPRVQKEATVPIQGTLFHAIKQWCTVIIPLLTNHKLLT